MADWDEPFDDGYGGLPTTTPEDARTAATPDGGRAGAPAWFKRAEAQAAKPATTPNAEGGEEARPTTTTDLPAWAAGRGEASRREPTKPSPRTQLQQQASQRPSQSTSVVVAEQTVKNWPMCCPRIHHDIDGDITDPARRSACRSAYYMWLVTATAYVWNWLAVIASLAQGGGKSVVDFFLALIVAAAGLVISARFLYFRGAYTTLQVDPDQRALPYLAFFAHFMFHMIWCAWMLVGPPIVGNFSAGLFFLVLKGPHLFSGDKAPGVFAIINVVLWGIALLISLRTGVAIMQVFRTGGGVAAVKEQRALAASAGQVALEVR